MKSWFRNGLLILTLIALITPALPVLAKDLPEERLVPPLGLLGTTADYSPPALQHDAYDRGKLEEIRR